MQRREVCDAYVDAERTQTRYPIRRPNCNHPTTFSTATHCNVVQIIIKENEQVYVTRSIILVCSSRGRNNGSH